MIKYSLNIEQITNHNYIYDSVEELLTQELYMIANHEFCYFANISYSELKPIYKNMILPGLYIKIGEA
jgi:predicted nucleic-acid-binding protein